MAKLSIDLDEDFDFGFSAVSEDELSQKEKEAEERARAEAEVIIKQQQQETEGAIAELMGTAQEYKDRLTLLHKAVMPLLKNLQADADNKPYIYWPDRKLKMTQFIAKVNAIVNG